MSEQSKIDAERALFEAQYANDYFGGDLGAIAVHMRRGDDGEYVLRTQRDAWSGWQARASLPVGVPDGYALVPVEPTVEMRQAFYTELNSRGVWRAMLAAAPTVKAEQVDREAFRAHLSECAAEVDKWPSWKRNCLGSAAEDCSPKLSSEVECMVRALEEGEWAEHVGQTELGTRLESAITTLINRLPAPSLPAAGSAGMEEVEVVAWMNCGNLYLASNYPGLVTSEPLMTVAQHSRIVAELKRELKFEQFTHETCFQDLEKLREQLTALSAQQSAPERVSVPAELPRITDRLAKFLEVVRGCERLASDYSGSIDGVDEHGGDDHDDPICAVFHRLYYAMFDGEKLLSELRALLASHGRGEA